MRVTKTIIDPDPDELRAVTKFAWLPRWFTQYVSEKTHKRTFVWLESYVITQRYSIISRRWRFWGFGDLTKK